MITLCGSTYAKFVCSIILKQPSITTCCSSSIELNLQAHSILESNSLLILFFFFTILIISHQPFLFNKKRQKKSTFYSRLNFLSGATILPFGAGCGNRTHGKRSEAFYFTTKLNPHWSWKSDLNWRPTVYDTAALPAELFQHIFIIPHIYFFSSIKDAQINVHLLFKLELFFHMLF